MRCRRCGFLNPDGFRFCGSCGAALVPDGEAPRAERKLVTALFCDVAGFTHRAGQLDPEDVHRFLAPYFTAVRRELERFGGTVEKFIGDAIMGLFGAPTAHGDDPERAVRAALAARDAVTQMDEADPDLDLHVRIGVTTGEALVAVDAAPRDGEGMAWGDVMNMGARLQAAAPIDGILVDDATYRATRDAIEYAPAEPVWAKGKATPVSAWSALAARARRGLHLAEDGDAPFVGRDAELALLVESLSRARRESAPVFVDVIGPAGIGKSRLVFELFRYVESGKPLINWRHGRSPPHPHGGTYWALGEIVKGQAGILETDDAEAAGQKLAAAVGALTAGLDECERIEAHLRPLVGLASGSRGPDAERGAAFTAWRQFLESMARQRPLVLVLEDLHWADDDLLDFVEHLRERLADVPLLCVGTTRPELFDRRPEWGRARTIALELTRLSDADTEALISLLPGEHRLPEKLKDALVARAAGNPLYAVEYMRMLADRGLVDTVSDDSLPLPESVQGIIAARLDLLPPEEKALLQEAAVVGKVVWPGALAAVGGRSPNSVERALRSLERKEFVVPTGNSTVEQEAEYRFRHVLVRDVAYGQIPRYRRGEIHRRVAEWLESLSPDRAVDRAEMLARHYVRALQLAQASGADAAELTDRARYALRDAGGRALSLHAFPRAVRFYRRAAELWPDDDPERPTLVFNLGKALYYAESGGVEELGDARDALLAAGELELAAEAESLLGLLAHHRGEQEAVFAHVERAAELVSATGPSRSKADVLLDLAGVLVVANDPQRAITIAREALAVGEALRLPQVEARALGTVGSARAQLGDAGALSDLERSIEIAESVGSPDSVFAYGSLADIACTDGDLSRCFELQARAKRQAEKFGYGGFVRWLEAERVGECYWRGEWSAALIVADDFIAEADAGRRHFMESYCRDMRGRIRLARGDLDGALGDGAAALAFARDAKDLQVLCPALAFQARALAAAARAEEAGAVARELLELWASRHDVLPAGSWVADLADALLALELASGLERIAASARRRTRWLDAAVAFAGGEFVRAATAYAAIGSRPDEAVSRLRAGHQLAEAGRESAARAQLARALAFFRSVEASAFIAEGDLLIAAAGGL